MNMLHIFFPESAQCCLAQVLFNNDESGKFTLINYSQIFVFTISHKEKADQAVGSISPSTLLIFCTAFFSVFLKETDNKTLFLSIYI